MHPPQAVPAAPVDAASLATALRALGIFYGVEQPLAATVAASPDEASAVRAFIHRERPHLLRAYDLESLVAMVMATRAASIEPQASIEARAVA